MDNNRLVGIHQHAFATTGALEKLRLENNRLSFDEASSPFQKRTSLKELNLRNNSITNILMDWNYHTLQLRDLDLSYNQITRLHYAQLEFLSSRITVNLTHNTITEINLSALEAIAALNDPIVRAHSTHLILNDNPLHCDCLLVHFMQFYRHELAPKIRKHFKITIDDLRCASPERVTNTSMAAVQPNELLCPLDSPNDSTKHCPNGCACFVRPLDKTLIVNCSSTGITEIPALPNLTALGLNATELFVENNNITHLPLANTDGYDRVVRLHAKHNAITHIASEHLPVNLTVLDLSDNRLTRLDANVLAQLERTRPLQKILLARNVWVCDCRIVDLLSFVRLQFHRLHDHNEIRCENNDRLTMINHDLCADNVTSIVTFCICVAVFGLLFGIVIALYYKYQQEVMVWLYAHKLCMWLCTEEDMDKDKKYDAFISFSHKDEQFVVEQLVTQLETGPNPYKFCLHFRDWIVGEFIPNQVSSH